MDKNRKNLIVKEIIYWKSSKLLPEHYCNFLLSLYTEGNYETEAKKDKDFSIFLTILIILLTLLVPISLLVIYFTELSFVLQMGVLTFSLFICLVAFLFLKGNRLYAHLSSVIFAIIFFLMQVQICTYFDKQNQWRLVLVILCNCLGWIIVGKKLKIKYFYISGIIGIIVFILLFLFKRNYI